MVHSNGHMKPSALRLLEELPGIGDVVWATLTRLADVNASKRVLFTSAEARAGTTVIAAASAIGISQHRRVPVCLIETNLRHPALAEYLGLEPAGLSDVLDGRAKLEDCLQEPLHCPGLLVLPAGTSRASAPGELATERFSAILAKLEQRCSYLVIDAAPILDHVETRLLLRYADGVLLVLRARSTLLLDAQRTLEILAEGGTPVLGSIFNDYRADGLFGPNLRANRSFERAIRVERSRTIVVPLPPDAAPVAAQSPAPSPPEVETPFASNGNGHAPNVEPAQLAALPHEDGNDAGLRRQIDSLERRIAKLVAQLELTEADLQRIAAMKNIDLGIASVHRSVQGLSSEADAQLSKSSLMKEIFQANLDLKTAMAKRRQTSG